MSKLLYINNQKLSLANKMRKGNYMNAYTIIIRSLITFISLLILTRILGKKQMGHLSFFNYITGITIGSIAGNMVSVNTENFTLELLNLAIWVFLTIVLDILSLKIPITRVIFTGEPTIVIKKGQIIEKSLKGLRMTLDNLTMLLREEGVFTITDVEYAILESNGEITVYRKENTHPVNREDLKIFQEEPKYLPCELIVNGNVIKKNLKEYNLSKEWLNNQLNKYSISDYKEVLYAELQSDGSIYVQKGK